MNTDTKSGGVRARSREVLRAAVRGFVPALAVLALAVLPFSVLCLVLALVSLALIPIGVGIVTTPWILTGVRALADSRRELAAEWCGMPGGSRPSRPRPLTTAREITATPGVIAGVETRFSHEPHSNL